MKHQKLLSGLILTGLLVLVCLTGSAAAADPTVTITPDVGDVTGYFTISTDAVSTNYQWQYMEINEGRWYNMSQSTATFSFIPQDLGLIPGYDHAYVFRVHYDTGLAEYHGDIHFFERPVLRTTPLSGSVGDTITLAASDTGYESIQWKVSKDGGPFVNVGTDNPQEHVPTEDGEYIYQAITVYGHDMYTQTTTATIPVIIGGGGDLPIITVSPLIGDLTTEITLTADNMGIYTEVQWQVSSDDGATWEDLSTRNPYTYVPGVAGEYMYRGVFSDGTESITITYDKKVKILAGPLPETAPISTAAFYIAGLFFIILYMFGLYCVYNDNIFGFIASGFAVLCSWALMALSAFGRVGDTISFFNQTSGEIVKQILLIDPSMVFMITFACIIMTIVFIVILVRFIAQLALLKSYNPEEEEEEE